MGNRYYIPKLDELIRQSKNFNKKYPDYDYGTNTLLLQQVIDLLNYSDNFIGFIVKNKYDNEYDNPYVIFGQIVYYIKECYKNGNFEEIKSMLKFVNEKLQDENEDVQTLAQLGVLENLDIYPEILPDIVDLMPEYMKKVFMKYYADYLKLED